MEKRRYTRLFPPLDLKFNIRTQRRKRYHVTVKDISIGGIRFRIDKPISKGEIVEGDLLCPDFSISIVGHVVWVKGLGFSGGKPWNEVGVEFSQTREENKKIILQCLIKYITGTQ
ncbi:MAG TPA: PilZ domain-containing protein [Candidatus Omnitrophica bacterium]|nr:PilZ domain-containing protein [Candidatus Omnitrophota bacterium]